jgi:hypothetical protein
MKRRDMKITILYFTIAVMTAALLSCHSGGNTGKQFCESGCLKDTLKFTADHPLKPYVYILSANCKPDSIIRSYDGLGERLSIAFDYKDVSVNRDFVRCVFKDTGYAYLLFNDCATGRGYQLKLPFNTSGSISKRSSGINNIDPKFSVAENMIAYTDRGNIYVEEVSTGKQDMMTFGEATDMDYDAIHETLDSVNITPERIWVKIKLQGKWTELEKKIQPK